MFTNNQIKIDGGLDFDFPLMATAQQTFPPTPTIDISQTIAKRLQPYANILANKRISITAGSRGITGIVEILRTLSDTLKTFGAEPVIVAAMGSHGGATEQGQREVLEGYGITSDSMSAPIDCSMEVECIGITQSGLNVFCQSNALHSDGIIIINKIKPHADFKGPIESGLSKMMVVGLGKHKGASEIHSFGFEKMAQLLSEAAELFVKNAPVKLGIGIIENAYDHIMDLAFIPGEQIPLREPALLEIAKMNAPKLLLPEIDVLIIEQIGKNVSGEGMDPCVTGRPGSYLQEGFIAPAIGGIVVLGITEESHGNGVGIGMADISTSKCLAQLDFNLMYTNAITSTLLGPARLPMIMPNDRDAISVAVRLCHRLLLKDAKIVRIRNTLHLNKIWISEAYESILNTIPNLKRTSEYLPLCFDEQGSLL